jgi:hypothetical protein
MNNGSKPSSMKTLSAAFEIGTKDGKEYLIKYYVGQNVWHVYAARGGRYIGCLKETRTVQFKNETRAKEILSDVLKNPIELEINPNS